MEWKLDQTVVLVQALVGIRLGIVPSLLGVFLP